MCVVVVVGLDFGYLFLVIVLCQCFCVVVDMFILFIGVEWLEVVCVVGIDVVELDGLVVIDCDFDVGVRIYW